MPAFLTRHPQLYMFESYRYARNHKQAARKYIYLNSEELRQQTFLFFSLANLLKIYRSLQSFPGFASIFVSFAVTCNFGPLCGLIGNKGLPGSDNLSDS